MKLNPTKCGILFLNKNINRRSKYIGDIPIVHKYTFLGITLTNRLKINIHT